MKLSILVFSFLISLSSLWAKDYASLDRMALKSCGTPPEKKKRICFRRKVDATDECVKRYSGYDPEDIFWDGSVAILKDPGSSMRKIGEQFRDLVNDLESHPRGLKNCLDQTEVEYDLCVLGAIRSFPRCVNRSLYAPGLWNVRFPKKPGKKSKSLLILVSFPFEEDRVNLIERYPSYDFQYDGNTLGIYKVLTLYSHPYYFRRIADLEWRQDEMKLLSYTKRWLQGCTVKIVGENEFHCVDENLQIISKWYRKERFNHF